MKVNFLGNVKIVESFELPDGISGENNLYETLKKIKYKEKVHDLSRANAFKLLIMHICRMDYFDKLKMHNLTREVEEMYLNV